MIPERGRLACVRPWPAHFEKNKKKERTPDKIRKVGRWIGKSSWIRIWLATQLKPTDSVKDSQPASQSKVGGTKSRSK